MSAPILNWKGSMGTVSEHAAFLLSRGWESGSQGTPAEHEALCADVLAVLDHPDLTSLSGAQFVAVVEHILLGLYVPSYSRTALRVAASLERVVQHVLKRPETTIEDACSFYETLYFLYWGSRTNIEKMRGFGPRVVAPVAAYARRGRLGCVLAY